MSKASEWAGAHARAESDYRRLEAERIEWCAPEGGCHVKVSASGAAVVRVSDHNHASLSPDSALALARWILDTFGDEAAS